MKLIILIDLAHYKENIFDARKCWASV